MRKSIYFIVCAAVGLAAIVAISYAAANRMVFDSWQNNIFPGFTLWLGVVAAIALPLAIGGLGGQCVDGSIARRPANRFCVAVLLWDVLLLLVSWRMFFWDLVWFPPLWENALVYATAALNTLAGACVTALYLRQ